MPISSSPYLTYTTTASGLFAAGLGINALVNPRGALAMWGFPHPGAVTTTTADTVTTTAIKETPEGRLAESLMMLYGSRTLALGVSLLATTRWGSRRARIAAVWMSTFIAFMDGWVSRRQLGAGEWNHWGFVSLS